MNDPDFFSIDGLRLEHCSWAGVGTPILMLHEGLGCIAMWRDFPQQVAEATGHPVTAWSRAGYGRSDPPATERAPDYLHREATLIPRIMNALAIESAHLFGHSDGASIALIAAAQNPARIRSLVIEAPHVYVEQITIDGVAKVRAGYPTSGLGARLARYHNDPERVFWDWNDIWLDPRFRDWNIETFLPAITQPVLMIQGCDDEYGTLDQLDRIAARVPGTERLLLEESGHSPHRDHPERIAAAVRDFLKRIEN